MPNGATGCTVVLAGDEGAVAGVDVRGSAPGTRETDLLRPDRARRAHPRDLPGRRIGLRAGGRRRRHAPPRRARDRLRDRRATGPDRAGRDPLRPRRRRRRRIPRCRCRLRRHPGGRGAATGRSRAAVGAGTGATVAKLAGPASGSAGGRRERGAAAARRPRRGRAGRRTTRSGDVHARDGRPLVTAPGGSAPPRRR